MNPKNNASNGRAVTSHSFLGALNLLIQSIGARHEA
jgi:hypothetical protein